MNKEFNLSDKIHQHIYSNNKTIGGYIWMENVKEFIQKLKEIIDYWWTHGDKMGYLGITELKVKIDKLAGEELSNHSSPKPFSNPSKRVQNHSSQSNSENKEPEDKSDSKESVVKCCSSGSDDLIESEGGKNENTRNN